MRDTGIADRLRAAGVPTVECDGWQGRGSESFSAAGSVNHHTAGSASGTCPSLALCINGRDDLAGPLCNVMQSREAGEGNDITMGRKRRPTIAHSAMIESNFLRVAGPMGYLLKNTF